MRLFAHDFPSIETLANEADRKLLKSISQCPSHVLRHLLIEKPTSGRPIRVYDLGPITLSYLLKIIGNFYLGPFIKLYFPYRVKHIARLSRGFQHYQLHCISCKHLCVCDRGVHIKLTLTHHEHRNFRLQKKNSIFLATNIGISMIRKDYY